MAENKQDALARAYAKLSSLRQNISQMTDNLVLEMYVNEYHAALDRLAVIRIDVSDFRIPDSVVQPKIIGPIIKQRGGVEIIKYSKEKYVDKSFILFQLDAILGYFKIITSEKPRKIGFSK